MDLLVARPDVIIAQPVAEAGKNVWDVLHALGPGEDVITALAAVAAPLTTGRAPGVALW